MNLGHSGFADIKYQTDLLEIEPLCVIKRQHEPFFFRQSTNGFNQSLPARHIEDQISGAVPFIRHIQVIQLGNACAGQLP